jgi:uncharacterized protein (DUF1810 family)
MIRSPQSDLARFVSAQAGAYDDALSELRAGQKRSHWMWFIFPQLAGLGSSPTAQFYAIADLEEARDYLRHPLLGGRLRDCTAAVLDHSARSLFEIFGTPDDLKFRSSMTLFAIADDGNDTLFRRALAVFCGNEADPRTLSLLAASGKSGD